MSYGWQPIGTAPENVVVRTKIHDQDGERNDQPLKRIGRLWFYPDGSMYVYYTPTHWTILTTAAMAGENVCDVCLGVNLLVDGKPCICGGTGLMSDAWNNLRREFLVQQDKHAEARERDGKIIRAYAEEVNVLKREASAQKQLFALRGKPAPTPAGQVEKSESDEFKRAAECIVELTGGGDNGDIQEVQDMLSLQQQLSATQGIMRELAREVAMERSLKETLHEGVDDLGTLMIPDRPKPTVPAKFGGEK